MRSPPPIPALRVTPAATLVDERLQVSLPLDSVGFAVARMLTTSRAPAELCAAIDVPRIAVQAWVARLCRHNLLATPRAQDQLALSDRVVLWQGYGTDRVARARLREDAIEGCAQARDLGHRIAAMIGPLHAHLDAEAARYRESELFATRAAFGVPEAALADQTARFFATVARVGLEPNAQGHAHAHADAHAHAHAHADAHAHAQAQAQGQAEAQAQAHAWAYALYDVASVARCNMEHLFGRGFQVAADDLVALFFCDVLTLVRGDPPRPLPPWL